MFPSKMAGKLTVLDQATNKSFQIPLRKGGADQRERTLP